MARSVIARKFQFALATRLVKRELAVDACIRRDFSIGAPNAVVPKDFDFDEHAPV